MKCTIEAEKVFSPITVTLTLETEEELVEFWHRLNVTVNGLPKAYGDSVMLRDSKFNFKIDDYTFYPLFTKLDDILEERGIAY